MHLKTGNVPLFRSCAVTTASHATPATIWPFKRYSSIYSLEMHSDLHLSNRGDLPESFSARFDRELTHYTDSLCYRKRTGSNKLIVIYEGQGCEDGNCSHSGIVQSVLRSMKLLEQGWEIRIYNAKIIKEFYPLWDHPKYLIDEMLKATIHLILCQGIHVGMVKLWHTNDCLQEMKRLEYHLGFPFGNKVRCPAFSGDKMYYLLGAPIHTLPSFMVELNRSEQYYADMFPQANRFCACSHCSLNPHIFTNTTTDLWKPMFMGKAGF